MQKLRNMMAIFMVVSVMASAQEKISAKAATVPPAAPQPDFTWGGDIRLRYEAYDGVHTLNNQVPFHDRDYFRLRARLWANYVVAKDLSTYARLAAEPRYWFNNSTTAGEGKEWKYALVDNVYAKWTTALADRTPLTVIAGRQDIQLGDQWLVSDGTPVDGSWTNYFDALRTTLDIADIKTKIDIIALKQQANVEDALPVIGRKHTWTVMEQDELGAILYATNKSIKNLQLEGYAIYKEDHRITGAGNNGTSYTVGIRAAGTPAPKWSYSAELARQWGRRDLQVRYPASITAKRDIEAYGFNAKLTYSFKDALANQITLLGEYLSGDDPDTTDKDEMFDILWGRYPRVGETWAAAYSLESGGRSSQYQNLMRVGALWAISPTKTTSVTTMYCALYAPEKTPTRSTNNSRFSRDGRFRGHQLQVIAKQKITKAISSLLFLEAAFLGDYYTQTDTITFVRAEVMYSF